MKEASVDRLLVMVPPRRALAGRQGLAASSVVSYVAIGGGKAQQGDETPIALLPKAAGVDLVFDTSDVFVAAIDAPRLSEARLRQALPNLLEERLLADAADCHFAFDAPRGSGNTTVAGAPKLPVAVIDRGVLTRALDVMAEAGYRVRSAYSEIYTVPAPAAGVLSVRADRGRGIARSSRHDGFAFDLVDDDAPPALLLAVRQLGIKRIAAYGREAERVFRLAGPLGVTVDLARREVDLDATEAAVDLLQGPFAQRGRIARFARNRLSLGSLRPLLIWGGVALATFIAGMNVYWLKLESEARALRGGMETSFRSAFPEATAVVDPVLQTRRQLGTLRSRAGIPSADDFSVLATQATQLMSMAPIGSVAGIEYRDGALRVKFKPSAAPEPGLQNALRAQAIQQGLTLRFDSDGSARLSPAGQ